MSRSFAGSGFAWMLVAALATGCAGFGSTPVSDVVTQERQSALTPDEVLADLVAGNERFVAGDTIERDYLAQARATAKGQYPKAIILGCVDSRVPPEIIFDQGVGDLFVGRVAGNFENGDLLGSMEFATKLAGSKLIVVLGHSACGAIKGAAAGAELGNLTASLQNLSEALNNSRAQVGASASNDELVAAIVDENVKLTIRDILRRSPVIREQVDAGSLKVVGGVYDLASGKVRWLD